MPGKTVTHRQLHDCHACRAPRHAWAAPCYAECRLQLLFAARLCTTAERAGTRSAALPAPGRSACLCMQPRSIHHRRHRQLHLLAAAGVLHAQPLGRAPHAAAQHARMEGGGAAGLLKLPVQLRHEAAGGGGAGPVGVACFSKPVKQALGGPGCSWGGSTCQNQRCAVAGLPFAHPPGGLVWPPWPRPRRHVQPVLQRKAFVER